MRELLSYCPAPPDWQVPWLELDARYDWLHRLVDCAQDPEYHAEGNVWIHTRMVCTALAELDAFRALDEADRQIVFLAALLHDIGKPASSKQDADGRITTRGHSAGGARLARRLLWTLGAELEMREKVVRLIRTHQLPFFLIEKDDAVREAYRVSLSIRCDLLALVAEADARGRHCTDPHDRQRMLDNVALFAALCAEHDCLDKPRAFPSALARFEYFRKQGRDPSYAAYDDTELEVIVMCGLPGAGKDTWIRNNAGALPVISLDEIRRELEVSPSDNQRAVVDCARERARVHLRAKQGFIWNATNLIRDHRSGIVDLCVGYKARVRIIYLEVTESTLRTRNRERENSVPTSALNRMIGRWTVPDITEAHQVDWILTT